jgi:chromosome segregation ATPase
MNRHSLFSGSCLALLLLLPACVSTSKYDEAVKSAEEANTERLRDRDALNALQAKADAIQAKLDDATAEDAKLRSELERLGTNADALLAEKGTLSSALSESKARLEELRRAHVAAEARARLYGKGARRCYAEQFGERVHE